MPKGVLIVPSGPSDPSREDEYNEWYDNTHVGEVRDVPGWSRRADSPSALFKETPWMNRHPDTSPFTSWMLKTSNP